MIGTKSQSRIKPAALGISLQSSTYGSVIPCVYGRTKGNVYLIWQNNLRKGDSGKTSKKILSFGKKGSQQGYLENVDFLLGHNPIAGVLQFWENQNQRYPLLFTEYTTTAALGTTSYAVPDAEFYQILGVTLTASYNLTIFDYGAATGTAHGGTYEIPLWNIAYAGPDPTRGYADRYFPYYFYWLPGSGPTILLPQNAYNSTGITGTLKIYYAQLDPDGSPDYSKKNAGTAVPAGALHLTFEPVLGDGPEFTGDDQNGNPMSTQQILYPQYAGLGSERLDLGSGTGMPLIVPEVLGTYPLYSTGDADYADMVEDILCKGATQAGFGAEEAYTSVHHGLGAFEFPGAVQLMTLRNGASGSAVLPYTQPNKAGNLLVAIVNANGGTPSLSDSAPNDWTPRLPGGHDGQLWTAVAIASPNNTVTISGLSAFWQASILEIGGVTAFDNVVSTLNSNTASITTSNEKGTPCYILAFVNYAANGATNVVPSIPHWRNLVLGAVTRDFFVQFRVVYTPGTYTYTVPASIADGSPTEIALVAFKCSEPPNYPRPLGNILDPESLELTRQQCRANGLYGSLLMDSQQKAADWLGNGPEAPGLFEAMDAAPVWSGFTLKVLPYSEVSIAGNGAIYIAPTASGPTRIPISDFIAGTDEPLMVCERTAQVDVPNILQIQFPNRAGDYNDATISEPETAAIAMYSPRKDSPRQMRMIQDTTVARMISGIAVRKHNYNRNVYKFKLQAKWKLLEPMTLIQLPADVQTGSPAVDVRLTQIKEDEKYALECEAEPFLYGTYAPVPKAATAAIPNPILTGVSPGQVNAPVFLEPTAKLSGGASELWIAVSALNKQYGGSQVFLSTDGGASYNSIGSTSGSAVTGVTVGDWPAAADPDTTNDLAVNLTESNGVLASYPVVDEDNVIHPAYVAGGSPTIPYELMTYAVAQLTGPSAYTLKATGGNHLRRAVDNAPLLGQGVDHPNGSRFAFIGPQAAGMFKTALDPKWIGQTLWFKFLAFNVFLGGIESLADAVAYPYTPLGSAGVQPTAVVFVDGVPVSNDYFFALDGISQGTMIPSGI